MKGLSYAAVTWFALSIAGPSFAQSLTRTPQTGETCLATDYFCRPPKGTGIDRTRTTGSTDPSTARLQNELPTPRLRNANGPEMPEQPVGRPIGPEDPIAEHRPVPN